MNIEIIKVGNLKCNCYLLIKDNKILIIDPGDEGDKIIEKIGDREVVGIIITHHHYDHIGAVKDVVNKYNVLVYDRSNLEEGQNKIDEFIFDIIYTPGHKEDLITIYFEKEKMMFTGDFLFKDNIGRCDLVGSDINDMKKSIDKIKKYDKDIIVYPGHGVKTSLGYEIDNNVYFLDEDML
ncbi:MAG: MBL fold metallo-hydrolase [Bacilli bacterium]|nr:MBL fold metallo-hydrolase [Bacilli bacterium]